MRRSQTAKPAKLTLIEVGRWTLIPRAGLESLLASGTIDVDSARLLNSLADLIHELGQLRPALQLDCKDIAELTRHLRDGQAIEEANIKAAIDWLDKASSVLRATKRDEYRIALARLIEQAELRALIEASRA